MKNNKFFFKDTASIITGALSTFADLKTEIDNVIKSRFEKFINSQGCLLYTLTLHTIISV